MTGQEIPPALFIRVEDDAFHTVVHQLTTLVKARPRFRWLRQAEFSPPHPWLRLDVAPEEIPQLGAIASRELQALVIGLVTGLVTGERFSFRRFEAGETLRILAPDEEKGSPEPWEKDLEAEGSLDPHEATRAVFRFYDLPRFSDHRLRIGPAWPFRHFDVFW